MAYVLRIKQGDKWIEVPALKGTTGEKGASISDISLKSKENGVSTYIITLDNGDTFEFQVTDGATISDISKIGTSGLVDSYLITLDDGTSYGFEVTNGRGIVSIIKTDTDVLTDTYTITYNDGTTSTYTVVNGRGVDKVTSATKVLTDTYTIHYNDGSTSTMVVDNGRGIDSITKSTKVLTDTYTIKYNDGTSEDFKVTNGRGITKITKTGTDENEIVDTYTITYNDNTTSTYNVSNGIGIEKIAKTDTDGIVDTYTITYDDQKTQKYHVTNGETGPAGGVASRIYDTGLVKKANDEVAYEDILAIKNSQVSTDTFIAKSDDFTTEGSPTISDSGILSSQSSSDYITKTFDTAITDFKMEFPYIKSATAPTANSGNITLADAEGTIAIVTTTDNSPAIILPTTLYADGTIDLQTDVGQFMYENTTYKGTLTISGTTLSVYFTDTNDVYVGKGSCTLLKSCSITGFSSYYSA